MNLSELTQLYYQLETSIIVSPHSLRKRIAQGSDDFTLIDVRSHEEYQNAHIITARNIPAYSTPDRPAYHEEERILEGFRQLPKNREIILYCYSKACMTGKKVGALLAKQGISALHLGIGWNEWRHAWTGWNHEHEWQTTRVEDYIAEGAEPGQFIGLSADEFGCQC